MIYAQSMLGGLKDAKPSARALRRAEWQEGDKYI